MRLWNEYTIGNYTFEAFIPTDSSEKGWRLSVTETATGHLAVERLILMTHAPVFGPDVDDVAELNRNVEEVIKELGLEE